MIGLPAKDSLTTRADALIARLRAAGVRFIMEPRTIEAAFGKRRIAFFETPDGLRTEVMEIIEDVAT